MATKRRFITTLKNGRGDGLPQHVDWAYSSHNGEMDGSDESKKTSPNKAKATKKQDDTAGKAGVSNTLNKRPNKPGAR